MGFSLAVDSSSAPTTFTWGGRVGFNPSGYVYLQVWEDVESGFSRAVDVFLRADHLDRETLQPILELLERPRYYQVRGSHTGTSGQFFGTKRAQPVSAGSLWYFDFDLHLVRVQHSAFRRDDTQREGCVTVEGLDPIFRTFAKRIHIGNHSGPLVCTGHRTGEERTCFVWVRRLLSMHASGFWVQKAHVAVFISCAYFSQEAVLLTNLFLSQGEQRFCVWGVKLSSGFRLDTSTEPCFVGRRRCGTC